MNHVPDKWEIVEIVSKKRGAMRKVLSSWYGGYTGSPSWRLSSDIQQTEEFEDRFVHLCRTGSVYNCFKDSQGLTPYTGDVFNSLRESLREGGSSIKIVT